MVSNQMDSTSCSRDSGLEMGQTSGSGVVASAADPVDFNAMEDMQEYGVHQALPVEDGEPDWESGPATTVEEYMKRVRWEAAQCARTTRAEIDPGQFDGKRTQYIPATATESADCMEGRKPVVSWMVKCLEDFKRLRETFQEMDRDGETSSLPIGVDMRLDGGFPATADSCVDDLEDEEAPELHKVQQLDQVETGQLLQSQVEKLISQQENTISRNQAMWCYTLMARLLKPCSPDVSSTLLLLLNFCKRIRAGVVVTNESSKQVLPLANLLIVLCGIYFGQDETMAGVIDIDIEL